MDYRHEFINQLKLFVMETRFKILALLAINMELPEEFQRKVDIVAQAIDRGSQYSEQFIGLLENQVLAHIENEEVKVNFSLN